MPNVMAALPNIGGALCSMPQSLADTQYWSAVHWPTFLVVFILCCMPQIRSTILALYKLVCMYVCMYISFDWRICALVVLGLVFPYPAKRLARGTSQK